VHKLINNAKSNMVILCIFFSIFSHSEMFQ